MPRENEFYRENLEMLKSAAPGKLLLTVTDVRRILGGSRERAQSIVEGHLVDGKYISIATLAGLLSK